MREHEGLTGRHKAGLNGAFVLPDPNEARAKRQRHESGDDDTAKTEQSAIWTASDPWDEASIPCRPWIAPGYLLRGSVTVVAGTGGVGKSTVGLGWAVSLVLHKAWSSFRPVAPCIVVVFNVEDDAGEQQRRLSATLRQFSATPHDLHGRLHRVGPVDVGTLFARDSGTGKLRSTAALDQLAAYLEAVRPDVLELDPMVALHDGDEIDNTVIRAFMAALRALAVRFNLAVVLFHHVRKGSAAAAGDADSIRGGSDIVGAARATFTLTTMTKDEAEGFGIDEATRRDYFRLDGAKVNYSRPERAEWFRRAAYDLANGEQVAAAVPWDAPSVWRDLPPADINSALDGIDAGFGPGVLFALTRRGNGNERWAGKVLMTVLDVSDRQAVQMLETWKATGLLDEVEFHHPERRKPAKGVRVNPAKRPSP